LLLSRIGGDILAKQVLEEFFKLFGTSLRIPTKDFWKDMVTHIHTKNIMSNKVGEIEELRASKTYHEQINFFKYSENNEYLMWVSDPL
jgi:hypothetical protein